MREEYTRSNPFSQGLTGRGDNSVRADYPLLQATTRATRVTSPGRGVGLEEPPGVPRG